MGIMCLVYDSLYYPAYTMDGINYVTNIKSYFAGITKYNKAIRDGKYLALPHSSAWQRPPPPPFFSWRHFSARSSFYILNW